MVLPVHRYELSVLDVLKKNHGIALDELVSKAGIGKDEVMWALENLKEKGFVTISYKEQDRMTINAEGKEYARNGLPAEQLLKKVEIRKIKAADLGRKGEDRAAMGKEAGACRDRPKGGTQTDGKGERDGENRSTDGRASQGALQEPKRPRSHAAMLRGICRSSPRGGS